MLDIQFIRENREAVAQKSKQKGYDVDIDELLIKDDQVRQLAPQVEELRRQRRELAESAKGSRPDDEQVKRGQEIKEKLGPLESSLEQAQTARLKLLKLVPNMPAEDVPVGSSEDQNVVAKVWGEKPSFDFQPKNHYEIAEARGLIDKTRAAKIAGARFAYIKGPLVNLQFALIQWVIDQLTDEQLIKKLVQENQLSISTKPYTPVLPPALIRTDIYDAMDRLEPRDDRYKIEGEELWLQGSAEHTLGPMYAGETLDETELPIRYLGFLTSFRREAGTYGKDTEGILRMHQFDKLEMESFSNSESGLAEHKLQIAIQEHLMQALGLPYRVITKCTADIGKPNARGIDIEVWLPGQGRYRETHTADFMTDYQARRLLTKFKKADGSIEFVNTNDATALALGRAMIAIIENYQTADGQVNLPEILRPYMRGIGTI